MRRTAAHTDYELPNEEQVIGFTGAANLSEGCGTLIDAGAGMIVRTLAEDGALLFREGSHQVATSTSTPPILSPHKPRGASARIEKLAHLRNSAPRGRPGDRAAVSFTLGDDLLETLRVRLDVGTDFAHCTVGDPRANGGQDGLVLGDDHGGVLELAVLDGNLDGSAASNWLHPAALVAAAATERGAGNPDGAVERLDAAAQLEQRYQTYYGAARVALGRIMLTTSLLGECPVAG